MEPLYYETAVGLSVSHIKNTRGRPQTHEHAHFLILQESEEMEYLFVHSNSVP